MKEHQKPKPIPPKNPLRIDPTKWRPNESYMEYGRRKRKLYEKHLRETRR